MDAPSHDAATARCAEFAELPARATMITSAHLLAAVGGVNEIHALAQASNSRCARGWCGTRINGITLYTFEDASVLLIIGDSIQAFASMAAAELARRQDNAA